MQVWEAGNGDEGKSKYNPLGPILRLTINSTIQNAVERVSHREKGGRGERNKGGISTSQGTSIKLSTETLRDSLYPDIPSRFEKEPYRLTFLNGHSLSSG